FAETDLSPEGILDFVNRYGRLAGRSTGFLPAPGSLPSHVLDTHVESVRMWEETILHMKALVQTWRAAGDNDQEAVNRFIHWDGNTQVYYHPPQGMRPTEPYSIASINYHRELFTRLDPGELKRPAMFLVNQVINLFMEPSDILPQLQWDHATGQPS